LVTGQWAVSAEATIAFPLIAGYPFHKDAFAAREEKRFARVLLEPVTA
jgi:deoxyhypusine synthase